MTLDEAIKRYTSNAFYEKSDGNLQVCLEFEQLAEWLKELKQLREQEPAKKVGRWIKKSNSFECTSCSFLSDFKWFYCPCCGEKKEVSDENSD